MILSKISSRHTKNTSHKPVDTFFCQKYQNSSSRGQKKELQKLQKKTEFSTNDPFNLLNAALRAVVKLYNQKFEKFLLKSELKAERVPVKPLKRFLWTRRRQF